MSNRPPKPIADDAQFKTAVIAMRAAQRRFKKADKGSQERHWALQDCFRLEALVDDYIEHGPTAPAPDLFNTAEPVKEDTLETL